MRSRTAACSSSGLSLAPLLRKRLGHRKPISTFVQGEYGQPVGLLLRQGSAGTFFLNLYCEPWHQKGAAVTCC